MSQSKTDVKKENLEIEVEKKVPAAALEKLGVTEEELNDYMEQVFNKDKPRKYFRILADDEKRMLTIDAYGFLINMMNIGSIDSLIFEKVIHISMQIYGFTRKKINREMITDILNMIVFSGKDELSLRDFLEVFGNPDGDYEVQEETN